MAHIPEITIGFDQIALEVLKELEKRLAAIERLLAQPRVVNMSVTARSVADAVSALSIPLKES